VIAELDGTKNFKLLGIVTSEAITFDILRTVPYTCICSEEKQKASGIKFREILLLLIFHGNKYMLFWCLSALQSRKSYSVPIASSTNKFRLNIMFKESLL
jgi:hypothetical protein